MCKRISLCILLLLAVTLSSFSQDKGLTDIQKTVFVELQNLLEKDGVVVEQVDGKILIKNAVIFSAESAMLKNSDKIKLDKIVSSIKKYPMIKLEIVGHCSSVGNPEGEQVISLERAKSVKKYLVDNKATLDMNIAVKGVGAKEQIAPDIKEADRAKNRRLEIIFVSFI